MEKIHNKPLKKKSKATKKVMQRKRTAKVLIKANLCDICDDFFENADQLSSHISRVHEETHRCAICNEAFTNSEILQSHLREAYYLIDEKCNFCDKKFVSSCEKTAHMKNCPKERTNLGKSRDKPPFGCGTCGESFYFPIHLADHARNHTMCKYCKRRFSSKELDNHEKLCKTKSSKGKNPETFGNRCYMCFKCFTSKSLLNLHLQSIHMINDGN